MVLPKYENEQGRCFLSCTKHKLKGFVKIDQAHCSYAVSVFTAISVNYILK